MKTKASSASIQTLLAKVDATRRDDCEAVIALMKKATGAQPVLWGTGIVGFGDKRLVYDSGRELDWFRVGLSPRKAELVLYGLDLTHPSLRKLGKHTCGKGCLYIKRLADVDVVVLRALIERAAAG
jgi:hypothetical protein